MILVVQWFPYSVFIATPKIRSARGNDFWQISGFTKDFDITFDYNIYYIRTKCFI